MAKISYNPFTGNFDLSGDGVGDAAGTSLTTKQTEILGYLAYDSDSRILSTTRAFETTLNSLYLGGQHKMSSGADNIFFTNLGNDTNYYPMWGGLKDQSLAANQGETGFIPPSGRIYGNMFSLPLGGGPLAASSIGYSGSNYFGVNIAGLGITVELAEAIDVSNTRLEYRLSINDRQVYMQELDPPENLYPGDQLEWFFDHPVEITAGTTIFAEIVKVSRTLQTVVNRATVDVTLGVLQVRMGDDGTGRYQTIVHNRLFEDKDIELISPYLKYQAMDFSADATGGSILLKDLSLAADARLLIPHAINTLEAVATGTTIQIKQKGGAKIFVESLPVAATSINGTFVNAVLNSAVAELNTLFTTALSFAVQDNPVTTFALSGDDLTITLEDGTSFTSDVTTLGVDTDNFVTSAALSGTTITLTMDDSTSVLIPVSSLAIDNDTTITSGSVTGNTMSLNTNSGSIITVDVTSLATGSSTQVSSGAVVGSNLVLTMSDASTVTIDASNMINGSGLSATNAEWFFSYGTDANLAVNNSVTSVSAGVGGKAPFYFGKALTRGSEFKWTANQNKINVLGIWGGAAAIAGTFHSRTAANWTTAFKHEGGGYINSSNVTLTNTTSAGKYTTPYGTPLVIRFGSDGHLTLIDLSGATEVEIAKTTTALAETTFNMQLGADGEFVFPNASVTDTNNIWNIVHDFAGTENGIIDGILDHTVLESRISIVKGEKIMFHLDLNGRGISFGTGYNNASTGISTAETQLVNDFIYETNEALVLQNTNGSDWNINTNATYHFDNGTGNPGYRRGGANVRQGMFSLRFTDEGKLTIFSEDNNEKVATAKNDPAVGSSIRLYYAVKEDTDYASIPEISKQSLAGGQQPNLNFVATVADQTVTVEEGQALNFTVVTSDNIVNQFAEVDAPSWMFMNQNTGVLSGTAPAYLGTGADTIVVNCKAGNAIGGTVNFLVTVTVASYASTNTQSLQFGNASSYLQGNAANISALQRTGNGSGASDAWSISMWVKPESGGSYSQTLFYYGGDDFGTGAEGRIELSTFGGSHILLRYGAVNNISSFGVSKITLDAWQHILVTYDGGLTGSVVADAANYYGAFKVYVNGVSAITSQSQTGGGYDGDINTDKYRIGKMGDTAGTVQFLTGKVDQVAIWGSDQQTNLATIYNSGVVQDLTLLAAPPEHYYEVEGSITSILDQTGSAHLTAFGFIASDLASDSP